MDYKTNRLNAGIEATESLLPEINGLYFGIMGESKALFDYNAYFTENKLTEIDYKVFMRLNKHYIETLSKQYGKSSSELFFQNTDGHILVDACLVFLFLAFANPEMCVYFNSLITDVISEGMAFSNGFIFNSASQRLPSEALNDIIKERRNDSDGEQ